MSMICCQSVTEKAPPLHKISLGAGVGLGVDEVLARWREEVGGEILPVS